MLSQFIITPQQAELLDSDISSLGPGLGETVNGMTKIGKDGISRNLAQLHLARD